MFRQLAILLTASAVVLLTNPVQAEALNVRLVMSGSTPPYQQFSAALDKALIENNANVTVIESRADAISRSNSNAKIDLVIAVGMKATEFAITDFDAPLLSTMIPRASYEMLREKHSSLRSPKAVSAIYLDQPWDRQLNFIQAALPNHNVIGVLYSPNTPIVLPRLPQGMSLNAKSVSSAQTLFAALENILNSSDVLLVIPDREIYSSSNVRNILLASYRQKVPLVGVSQAYVNAGALCAIFSTPEQLAKQAAKVIISFSSNRQLPGPQHPDSFSIGINNQVARSLGIEMASPDVIRERMKKAGEGE
ncbi:MAG: ABC transporter substrate binding protein [Gallionella sp.]|nr:ABC transporter substrate binding protein [Gallionella sp.]